MYQLREALNRVRERFADEAGFTLFETLLVVPMALLVLGTAFGAFDQIAGGNAAVTARAQGVVNQQTGTARIARDVRQIAPGTTPVVLSFGLLGNYGVDVNVCKDMACTVAKRTWVRWNCNFEDPDTSKRTGLACARSESAAGAGRNAIPATGLILVTDVDGRGGNFIYNTAGSYLDVLIRKSATDAPNGVTLSDRIALRNVGNG